MFPVVCANAASSSSGGAPVLLAAERLGRLEHRDLVEHLAAAQRVLDEVAARADVDDDVGLGDVVLADLLDRDGAPVGDVGGVDRLVADQALAGGRVQPVGRDDQAPGVLGAVGQGRRGAALGVLIEGDVLAGAQVDAGPPAGPQEEAVQVGAVHDQVGRAVAALQVLEVEAGQHRPVEGVLHDHAGRQHAEPLGLVEQAVVVEDAGAVGGELEAGPDLGELGRALEHPHPEALAGQRERGREAADAAADDDHVRSRWPGGRPRPAGRVTGHRAISRTTRTAARLTPRLLPRWPG
jgi:hypothetical protein